MNIAKKIVASAKHEKNLRKMWKQSYAGMCNRAIVLDKVVSEANKQGVKIKPLVISNEQNPERTTKKKYIGLGKKFYTLKDKKAEEPIGQVSHSHLLSENRPLGGAAERFVCFDLKMLLLLYLSCSFLFFGPFLDPVWSTLSQVLVYLKPSFGLFLVHFRFILGP